MTVEKALSSYDFFRIYTLSDHHIATRYYMISKITARFLTFVRMIVGMGVTPVAFLLKQREVSCSKTSI
jgi:hypothetical protein